MPLLLQPMYLTINLLEKKWIVLRQKFIAASEMGIIYYLYQ